MILTIETSIKSGSLAVFDKRQLVDFWTGSETVSRSEDLIVEIKNLLVRNEIKREQIEKIIVSRGPGSFTGLRVGTATAMGLAFAWDCRIEGISMLAANFLASGQQEGLSIISTGRDSYSWQFFTTTKESEIYAGDLNLLCEALDSAAPIKVIISETVANELTQCNLNASDKIEELFIIRDISAILLGSEKLTDSRFLTKEISPIYVRPATSFKI